MARGRTGDRQQRESRLGVDLVDNKTKGISTSNVTLSIGTIHSLMEDLVVLYITT